MKDIVIGQQPTFIHEKIMCSLKHHAGKHVIGLNILRELYFLDGSIRLEMGVMNNNVTKMFLITYAMNLYICNEELHSHI